MVEESQGMQPVKKETAPEKESAKDVEAQINDAMRARVSYFKQQADSLTFEGVRRLLEKDLGLEKFALDVHKRFVKQCLVECLDGADDDNASKDSGEIGGKHVISVGREAAESPEGFESKIKVQEPNSEDEEKMEDSPVMGLLTAQKTTKSKTKKTQDSESKEVPSESNIKNALWKRASYIKANSEKVTMAGLRRLLEEDLNLSEYALDPYKKFISNQLDEVLKSGEVSEPKKKIVKKDSPSKISKMVDSEETSESSDTERDEEVKTKKKTGVQKKMQKSDGPKKRGRPEKETKISGKKRCKSDSAANDDSDGDTGNASEDEHLQSSAEKPSKKKESSTPTYGKHVEHLKSVIKSCGMSVPPVVYKKVKQVPENKREAQLIKELEDILSKEGLSSNPTEKEIKDVRRRKERAKELEGIDTSNIVSTSRRRSTTSFVAPPKPKIPVESDDDDTDETEDDDVDDDDNDNEEDDNDEDDGNDDGDDESQSDELDEDHEDSD